MKSISVCVCTYKREKLLRECLSSIIEIKRDNFSVNLIIIDNDIHKSSEETVKKIRNIAKIEVYYFCEPKKGIPHARNKAINEVKNLKSDYLAFVDDDEIVDSDWLRKLFNLAESYDFDVVVSGSVSYVVPMEVPEYLRSFIEDKKKSIEGEEVDSCATNNVLVPMRALCKSNLIFDTKFPLAGGTDTVFFKQLSLSGIKIVKCPESIVYEKVPFARASVMWLSKRKFRVGITQSWKKKQDGRLVVNILGSHVFQVFYFFFRFLLCSIVFNKKEMLSSWLRCCKSLGVIAGFFGLSVDSYK